MKEKTKSIKTNQLKSNKRKKRIKWFGFGLLLIIGYGLLRGFFIEFVINNFKPEYNSRTLNLITWIFSLLLPLFIEILIVYLFILWERRKKLRINDKLKKKLGIGLATSLIFLSLSALAFFTKVGVIPNWFDIELLDSSRNQGIPREYIPMGCNCGRHCACKPIIYLYPTTETQVNVTLGNPKYLSHTYPKYNLSKGWNVIAQPNGDLEDMDTGRKLYALYREGNSNNETNFDEGFVLAGKDIIPFLEEKLAILGLNEREAEEFIVYWLPQMENNKYNLIRFETKEEQNKNMPLNITPTPDTIIRVMMDWKVIDKPIEIPEQKLVTPERTGFTVVERGGSPRN